MLGQMGIFPLGTENAVKLSTLIKMGLCVGVVNLQRIPSRLLSMLWAAHDCIFEKNLIRLCTSKLCLKMPRGHFILS